MLAPLLRCISAPEKIKVVLDDGVIAYGSSFLSEAFGGAVKHGLATHDRLLSLLEFEYADPDFKFYEDKIIQYIEEEGKRKI
jgi:hypothetical protein